MRSKIFDGRTWYPLLCIIFFDTPIFLKHWRDAHEIFWQCETKNFGRKNVIPPFSCIKRFETRIFLKNSRIPLRNFSELWDKIFDWKSWYSLLLSPPPPLIHNFFSIPEFFWYTDQKGSPYEIFQHWDKKNFDTKSWDKSLKHKIFRYPKLVTHWRFPLRNFSALWDRHFLTENRDTPSSPPPSYP